MRTLHTHYPLSLLCRVLEVSRSGYYAWQHRRPSTRAQEDARLEVAIQAAHVRTRQTYGPERLQAELRADGFPAGVGRIKRLRKKLGLRCQQVRRFTTTTDSTHALPVAENVLATNICGHTTEPDLGHRHHVRANCGRLVVSRWD